jgi:hypothetical protein
MAHNKPQSRENSPGSAHPLQRVILYKNVQYRKVDLNKKNNNSVYESVWELARINNIEMGPMFKMADQDVVYNAEKKFEKEDVEVEKSKEEERNEKGATKSKEITLEKRKTGYPDVKTLFAPIDKAIIVINNGYYQFVGTSGLINCVEVMIEYHTETDKGYLVAHVNGGIEDDETEIRGQLTIMLEALGNMLKQNINWEDFEKDSPKHKLTLVRSSNLKEQRLLINMRNILAESGAHMRLVNSNSATMEITVEGAKYYDNQPEEDDKRPVKTDYRDKEGYPFPEN